MSFASKSTKWYLKCFLNYFSDFNGNATAMFGLSAGALLAAAGAAIDLGITVDRQTSVQAVIDLATLTGVETSGNNAARIAAANAAFTANAASLPFDTSELKFTFSNDSKELHGRVVFKSSNSFMSLFSIQAKDMTVKANAVLEGESSAFCIHSLNASQSSALILNNKRGPLNYSGPSIIAPKCSVQVNSSSSSALLIKDSTTDYNFQKFCIVGGVSGGLASLSPAPSSSCKTSVPDPLTSLTIPTGSTACSSKNFFISSSGVSVTPGNYCGGLSIAGSHIVFSPGIYSIESGDLKLLSSNGIDADGVTFVMKPGAGSISIQSSGVMNLKAPTSGPTANFIIIDKSGTRSSHLVKSTVRDASWLTLDGIIYTPEDHFQLFWQRGGTGANERPLSWANFGLIANTIDMHGYNQLYIEPAKILTLAPDGSSSGVGGGIARLSK